MLKKFLMKMRRLPRENGSHERNVTDIPVKNIVPNPYQPHRYYNEKALKGLAESIKTHGLLQPVVLRKTVSHYEIVSGERRVRAFKLLGYATIPALVGKFTDGEMLESGLIENLQRKDLTPLEEAMGFSSLSRLFNPMTQDEFARFVGKRMGKSAEEIFAKLKLLAYPPVIREAIHREWVTEEQAQLLKEIPSEEEQLEVIDKIRLKKITDAKLAKISEKYKEGNDPGEKSGDRNEALALTVQLLHNVVSALEDTGLHASLEEGTEEKNGAAYIKLLFRE